MAFEDSDIYQAILDGDLAALGCSVREQDVNLRDNAGKSYLHICIELGQATLVEYLAQKVFLGFRDYNGHTALDLAVRYRMQDVERQLIRRVAGMQDSDDTQALLQLFQAGWRAWPPVRSSQSDSSGDQHRPLPPGQKCQLEILELQHQVDRIHWAVHRGQLNQIQEAVTDESLVLVCDHTGLPPLQKAVLFEWLSMVQYLSRAFPRAVNHPDHMGRTALHYAAAYTEYQDNILYKHLLRAGASEHVSDLLGFKPTDFLMDPSLLSIEHMREEVMCRISQVPKDYALSYTESCSLPASQETSTSNCSKRRWRAIASVACFAHNQRKVSRYLPFEDTHIYEAIITNDVYGVRHMMNSGEDMSQRSVEGCSYLHLAVTHFVSSPLISLLLTQLSPAVRDGDGLTPLELALLKYKNCSSTSVFLNVITGLMLDGDVPALQSLVQDGWQYWPDEDYVNTYLAPQLSQQMRDFLSAVDQFVSDVREVHKAAILHQTMDSSLWPLLDTEAAVTTLDCVGLTLVHICVIFYNIKLLDKLLQDFPFTANIRDSMGRTPLHYAAGLDDDGYMYGFLRAAHARDDIEDMWGQRPCDYTPEGKQIMTPGIHENIRDKLHNPVVLKLSWPTCLLSASMESSKVYEAMKANDVNALEAVLSDPSTDLMQRDCEGQGFLHHAVLTGAGQLMLKVLVDKVDLTIRDNNGNTVMDHILSGFHPDPVKEAVEGRVKELILGGGEYGEKETQRLLLAGWSHWPVSSQEPKAARLLDKLTILKDKVSQVHKAVQEGRVRDLKALLDHKLLAAAPDDTGLPPLHKAVLWQQAQVLQYLIKNFADLLNATDNMHRTALHYAAALIDGGGLYRCLTKAGADETIRDLIGKSAADYRQQPDALPVASLLKKARELHNQPLTSCSHAEEDSAPEASLLSTQPKAPSLPPETPKPAKVQQFNKYTRCPDQKRVAPPTTLDGRYIAHHLGTSLTLALAEIVEKRPCDPIEYLAQWLFKYRENQDSLTKQRQHQKALKLAEQAAREEEFVQFNKVQEALKMKEEACSLKEEEAASKQE